MAGFAQPDFPFYRGQPTDIAGAGWLVILASLAAAFAALTNLPLREFPLNILLALIFTAIPMIALRAVAGPVAGALFKPVSLKDVGLIVVFGFAALAGSLAMALILSHVVGLQPNPISDKIPQLSALRLAMLFVPTAIQLVGEELLAILPFLAILWICDTRLGIARRWAIVAGLMISSLIFGAAHLPTYDWHWTQALIGIGFTRVLLTLAYIATRNLWVSAGAHILNDWAGFLFIYGIGHIPINTDV